jgi:hypothetical protein
VLLLPYLLLFSVLSAAAVVGAPSLPRAPSLLRLYSHAPVTPPPMHSHFCLSSFLSGLAHTLCLLLARTHCILMVLTLYMKELESQWAVAIHTGGQKRERGVVQQA